MATFKSQEEIKILTEGGKRLASVLKDLAQKVKPGISAYELEENARFLIAKAGGKPAFLNYSSRGSRHPYPAALCVSINDEVVHGIPRQDRFLREGDIVSLDLGFEYEKLFTDMALTVGVGKISAEARKLMNITEESLRKGIEVLKEGAALGDYGFAVEHFVESSGFNVVRNLVGHGVGYGVHEDPDIPNWGVKGQGLKFKAGMVVALEPMVSLGKSDVVLSEDGWTWKTKDGSLAAHFEHTVAIEKNGCRVLTKL